MDVLLVGVTPDERPPANGEIDAARGHINRVRKKGPVTGVPVRIGEDG